MLPCSLTDVVRTAMVLKLQLLCDKHFKHRHIHTYKVIVVLVISIPIPIFTNECTNS